MERRHVHVVVHKRLHARSMTSKLLGIPAISTFTVRRHTEFLGILATNTSTGGRIRSAGYTKMISSWQRRPTKSTSNKYAKSR